MKKKLKNIRKLLQAIICSVLFLTVSAYGQAQTKVVSGKITAEDGNPMSGISVIVKGAKRGVITDAQGNFSITVPDNAKTLIISYVGHEDKEVAINGRENIDVVIGARKVNTLDDVVVVGYGTVKKSDVTGAVSSVKGSDLNKLPTQRVDQALQGRAAGVKVQNTDGEPGGNVTIRVRGGNSILGGNNALIVIDGMQAGNIGTINPNDVESIEVLKDASATAIYGARGANGVILITTKKGKVGKSVVSYNFSVGSQDLNKKLSLLNGADYAQKSNDYAATQNGTNSSPITPVLPFTQTQIDALKNSGGTDWQNEIYRTGAIKNHQLSLSGGTENMKYFVSGGMLDQNGIVVNTKYKRYTLRSNLDFKANNWINAGVGINLMKDRGNVPPTGEGTYFSDILGQVINTVARFDPATPVYDALGNYNFKALRGGPANNKLYADPDVWNPLAAAMETQADNNNTNTEVNSYLDFKLLEGLQFRVTGSAAFYSNDNKRYYGSKTQVGAPVSGMGFIENDQTQYYQNSNILTYNKTFNKVHRLTLTAVAEQQLTKGKYNTIEGQGFFSDLTAIDDLAGAAQLNRAGNLTGVFNNSYKTAINSFLGRVNYIYNDKYFATVSYRADGSSVFGANNKWGYFPSGALAWKASNENFIKNLNIFSNLKLRASWGITGNQGITPYQSLPSVISGANYPYNGTGIADIGFSLGTAGNPNLKWETTTQTDLGIDIGFFNERLNATVDVYNKETNDLLLEREVASYTGFSSILSNVGAISNKGLEITIGATPIAKKDFKWTTGANISFNKSKVLALADGVSKLNINTNTGGGYNLNRNGSNLKQLRVGESVEQMYGYTYLGTWSEAERAQALAFGQLPGDAKWLDVNGDGKINLAGDGNTIIGDANPKFIYGFNNSFVYKNFDLSFLIQGSQGNDIFNAVRIKTENPINGTSSNLNNRWTIDNQNTDVPAFTTTRIRNAQLVGHPNKVTLGNDNRFSRWVEDGSFVRLKNITLTYNLPASILNKIHVGRLSVYVTGANLITNTKYTGYDPEVSSFNRGNRVRAGGLGIDLSNYPTAKTFIFGLNLTL